MRKPMLASDRVLLLLSLVPYLREHGPTTISELAETFEVQPKMLRNLISFLGTAGIPGETLSYQHNDLFDIDWDAFELHDTVSLTQTVAIDETPRFTGVETAALLAGLTALKPMLGAADAELATQLSERLGAAMNASPIPAVAVSDAASDPRLGELVEAIESQRAVSFSYRDAQGAASSRTLHPSQLFERSGIWYVRGLNVERDAERTFRVPQMADLKLGAAFDVQHQVSVEERESEEIVAVVPNRLLPAIRGFAPEVLQGASAAHVPAGASLIRFEAWHPGAAVRLAQHGPGVIEIVSPPAARQAVSEWAAEALKAYGE